MMGYCVRENWEGWFTMDVSALAADTIVFQRQQKKTAEMTRDTFVYIGQVTVDGVPCLLFAEQVGDWPRRLASFLAARQRTQDAWYRRDRLFMGVS